MSAWKQFLASDVIVNPFVVNKGFTFRGGSGYGFSVYGVSVYGATVDGSFNSSDVGIDRFLGTNVNWFEDQSTTGTLTTQYQALIYNSVKQLYYSNFLSSSTGDNVAQPVLFLGSNPSGDVLIGGVESPLYDNFLQSTLLPNRYWPTGSGDQIAVVSIPSKLYGEYIVPNSFVLEYPTLNSTIMDDGQGNLNISSSAGGFDGYIGNIIYTHGLAILTDNTLPDILGYTLDDYVTEVGVTCSFSSSMTIYETQYKCTIRESEFNFSLNPSLTSGSEGNIYGFVTASYFSPYVTTVGLYDEAQNLLAVGKLSQPLPTSDTTDTTILVNLDR
jgi:hypothetical protein